MARIPVAVVGVSGYTGAELVRLLVEHPRAEPVAVYARRAAGEPLEDVYPQFAGRLALPVEAFDAGDVARRVRIAFVALPHGASAPIVGALRDRGVAVIDLSADFRLHDVATYERWYAAHPRPELLGDAVYGLPERHRAAIAGASLVACPGCYPTATVLAIAPLLAAGLVAPAGIVIDAKSGASGAGRTPARATQLAEAGEGLRAYTVGGGHRHIPEIEQELAAASGAGDLRVTFTPHLCPMSRGIFASVYATPTDPSRGSRVYHDAMIAAYAEEPFVTVRPERTAPDTAHVRGSNRAHVGVAYDARAGRVIAMAAIDNLCKGAAGQAVQCLNVMRGWEETAGLGGLGLFP